MSHSRIASAPPAGLVPVLAPLKSRYTNDQGVLDRTKYARDAISLTQLHWSPWDVSLKPEQVARQMEGDSFWAMFRALNEVYAERKGADHWMTKEPELAPWTGEIVGHFPEAKFIWLVRDGRDVALSRLRGRLHEYHVFAAAKAWSTAQQMCSAALDEPAVADRVLLVRYEDLVGNPEEWARRMAQFIGLEYETDMLNFYQQKEVIEYAGRTPLWRNLSKPVHSGNTQKYKLAFSERQICIIEAVAWDELLKFGYQTELRERPSLSRWQQRILPKWSRILRQVGIRFSRQYWRRRKWRKQARLIAGIVSR